MPKISVVMSVYNEPVEWMKQAIDSILNQTFSDFEFIIINDKPDRKENKQLLDEYASKDPRIVIITNEQNIGLTKSLNKGLLIAQGEYIARMDADDICLPERFEKQLAEFYRQKDLGVCGSNVECFGKANYIFKSPETNDQIYLFVENNISHSVIMVRADLMRKYLYNESCKHAQDYDLWFRMYSDGVVFYNIQEILLRYRISSQQISANFEKSQNSVGRRIRRIGLNDYLKKQGISYTLGDNEISLKDIGIICNNIKIPDYYYQKLLLNLSLSVNKISDRIILLFTIIPKHHIHLNYYFYLLYFYITNKHTQLF